MIKVTLLSAIKLYKYVISPLLGPRCRFYPSCSDYMAEAVRRKGAIVGVRMGLWRLLRCNPLCQGGYDPVERENGENEL